MTFDRQNLESLALSCRFSAVKRPCPPARLAHSFCESGGLHVTLGKIGILVPGNPIDVDQQWHDLKMVEILTSFVSPGHVWTNKSCSGCCCRRSSTARLSAESMIDGF